MIKQFQKLSICLILFSVSLFTQSVFGLDQIDLKTEMWSRSTALFDMSTKKIYDQGELFSLKRGYFGVESVFNKDIKGRLTIDFMSDDRTITEIYTTSISTNKTGGLKMTPVNKTNKQDVNQGGDITVKYAYLNFNTSAYIPDTELYAGCFKNYFGTVYDWEYLTIEKAPEDLYGVASSADYGIGLLGDLPSGFGEYALTCYNGEGYKKTGLKIDNQPALGANLRIIALPGITVGGSMSYENKLKGAQLTKSAGVVRVVLGPVDTWFEYVNQLNQAGVDIRSQYLMVMPVFRLEKLIGLDMEVIGRLDYADPGAINPQTQLRDWAYDDYRTWIGGVNFNLSKNEKGNPELVLQLNYEAKQYVDKNLNLQKELHTVMAQVKWMYGATVYKAD